VPIDRAATLRNAEKLIRQGKIDAAIAEYVRIVEDQPQDWAAKNTLGDLYGRAGQADKAVQQFVEIANNLSDEGQMAKAGALYKKILKLKPDHEHSLMQVADVLAMQRLYADARAHLTALMQLREGRGDKRGALQAKARIGALDPEDYSARMMGVGARIEMGDKAGALGELKEMASELADKGRTDEAVAALREAATLHPGDDEVREKLYDVYVGAADYSNARECASSLEQLRMIAASQEGAGDAAGALDTLRFAARAHPDDRELGTELARKLVALGDMTAAAEYLTAETAGDDPELLLLVADIKLRGADADAGVAILRRLLEQDPGRREQIALLGWKIAETAGEAGFKAVEVAADSAVAQSDWPGAAAALQEFVTRVPNHIPALMRLVEICVDGGLEATMYSAQAHLADAYIAAGSATEARFIAEDLVAREPWESANIERFRKALELMGEPDPDALIASRLSGESPFMSTDLAGGSLFDDPPPPPADLPAPDAGVDVEDLLAGVTGADEPQPKAPPPRKSPSRLREDTQYTLSANAIDLDSILGGFDDYNESTPPSPQPTARASAASDDVEVDLSIVLDDIKPASRQPPSSPPPAEAAPAPAPADLDGVFGNLRDQAARRGGADEGEKDYRRALALRAAGDVDGCIQALEKASRSPKLRFGASWLIARLYRERDMLPNALEWLERASEAPAPTSDESNQLLYELADGLEKVGEVARALAICLELQSEAGAYKDVDARIDRLTKVQAGS
jgi:tetratricopeptide (TPR) repeat protein